MPGGGRHGGSCQEGPQCGDHDGRSTDAGMASASTLSLQPVPLPLLSLDSWTASAEEDLKEGVVVDMAAISDYCRRLW